MKLEFGAPNTILKIGVGIVTIVELHTSPVSGGVQTLNMIEVTGSATEDLVGAADSAIEGAITPQ